MLRAIQNEIEPSVGWTSSLPASPLWGHRGTTRATLARRALSLLCLVGLQGKCEKRQSSSSWLSGREYGIDGGCFEVLECDVRTPAAKSVKDFLVLQRKKSGIHLVIVP